MGSRERETIGAHGGPLVEQQAPDAGRDRDARQDGRSSTPGSRPAPAFPSEAPVSATFGTAHRRASTIRPLDPDATHRALDADPDATHELSVTPVAYGTAVTGVPPATLRTGPPPPPATLRTGPPPPPAISRALEHPPTFRAPDTEPDPEDVAATCELPAATQVTHSVHPASGPSLEEEELDWGTNSGAPPPPRASAVPPGPPSDRSTSPTLGSTGISAGSSVELPASDLESDRDVARCLAVPPPPPSSDRGDRDVSLAGLSLRTQRATVPDVGPFEGDPFGPTPGTVTKSFGSLVSAAEFYPTPWPEGVKAKEVEILEAPRPRRRSPSGDDRTWETKETVRPPAFTTPPQAREARLSQSLRTQSLPAQPAATRPRAVQSHPAPDRHASETAWASSTRPEAAGDNNRGWLPRGPRWLGVSPDARRSPMRRAMVPILATHLVLAAAVIALTVGITRLQRGHEEREPRLALSERSPLAGAVAPPAPVPPLQGCTPIGASRILAHRAQIGPGLDVSVLDTGFGVGLASGNAEAVGVRVEGSGLKVAETLRVKTPATQVHHVAIEPGREDDADGFDVRIDQGDARTVIGGAEAPPFKVVARGGVVSVVEGEGPKAHHKQLWLVPPAKVTHPAKPATEVIRAVGREDGGAVVALRRPAMLLLGVVDPAHAAAGPLVSILRKGATVGTPALATWGGGGAVAWAERPAGEREFVIMVASFSPDGEGATHLGRIRVIGKGMSPSIAELPDGDLLLAHSDGPAGAHRVVAVRLAPDLEPRGEAITVSPESTNAGQPVAAVRADGRALVAFFAAERGRAPAVLATPLSCDPGL